MQIEIQEYVPDPELTEIPKPGIQLQPKTKRNGIYKNNNDLLIGAF